MKYVAPDELRGSFLLKDSGTDDPAAIVQKALDELRTSIDGRLKAVETKGADAALVSRLDQLEARLNRPGAAAADKDADTERKAFIDDAARRNVERRPNDLSARQALGLLYLERTQFDDAIAHFQEAQKGSVVRTAALLGLARAYKGKKQYELAVAQFILVKAEPGPLDEQRKEVIYQLGECYELLGRREQAIGEFKAIYAEDVAYRDVAARINAYYTK